MLRDLLRFNALTTRHGPRRDTGRHDVAAAAGRLPARRDGFSATRSGDWYLLPMAGGDLVLPDGDQMLAVSRSATFARFCDSHGLLQVARTGRSGGRWRGGARQYVEQASARRIPDVRLGRRGASAIRRDGVTGAASSCSDRRAERATSTSVVVATPSATRPLAVLLGRGRRPERAVLGAAIRYQPNRAVLHTDTGEV